MVLNLKTFISQMLMRKIKFCIGRAAIGRWYWTLNIVVILTLISGVGQPVASRDILRHPTSGGIFQLLNTFTGNDLAATTKYVAKRDHKRR